MPAPRKPSDHHELTGAYSHNPKRKRKDPKGVGVLAQEPPAHLDFDRWQTRAWKEIVSMIPAGVGTGSDALVVECLARIVGAIRKTTKFTAAEIGQVRYLAGSLGLSPEARARLGAPGEESEPDPLEEFRKAGASSPRAVTKTLQFKPRKK